MKIVIVGAGFTGRQLAKKLINERNEVVLIDNSEEVVRHASNSLDCDVKEMDGNSLANLEEVGIGKADALVCVTSNDEVNMITCSLVDSVYPDILKIARVRNFSYYMDTAAAVKKHAETFTGKHRPLYGIDYMINPDIEAAEAVVHAVESGAVSDVVTFENSEYEISRITIAHPGGRMFRRPDRKPCRHGIPAPQCRPPVARWQGWHQPLPEGPRDPPR